MLEMRCAERPLTFGAVLDMAVEGVSRSVRARIEELVPTTLVIRQGSDARLSLCHNHSVSFQIHAHVLS